MAVVKLSLAVVAGIQLCYGFDWTFNMIPEPIQTFTNWFGSDANNNNNNNHNNNNNNNNDDSNGNGRIVGGHEASIEDYPHQISFLVDDRIFCGGFIISSWYIVTAAHCVHDVTDSETVHIGAGSSFRSNGTTIPIDEVISHPEFSKRREFDKDVAVMRTEDPITFSDVMQPIRLPRMLRHPMVPGSKVTVSGWGLTQYDDDNSQPERLRAVEVPVVTPATCFLVYPDYFTENEFCAGDVVSGGKAPCKGDSGGAAVQDGMAVGIVSYSTRCAERGIPTIFAEIAAPPIRRFIKKHTGV